MAIDSITTGSEHEPAVPAAPAGFDQNDGNNVDNGEMKEERIDNTSQQMAVDSTATGSEHEPAVPKHEPAAPAAAADSDQKEGRNGNDGEVKEAKVGKTCHQCRQVIKGLSASCKNVKKGKLCPSKFCLKCLLNRYGEKAEEKAILEEWSCPKCRGICNCSICMKRQGHRPTGILVHKAKASGYSSVSDLLKKEGPGQENNVEELRNENDFVEDGALNSRPTASTSHGKIQKKKRRLKLKEPEECTNDDGFSGKSEKTDSIPEITLPQGTEVTIVAGISLPPEDIGQALQFLEFCASFKEILDLKDGEPEYIVLELVRGGSGCQGKHSLAARFQIILLTLIQNDMEQDLGMLTYKSGPSSWLHALQKCVSTSRGVVEKFKLGNSLEADYCENLSSCQRLGLLNFLCDEVLSSEKVRTWMDDQHSKFIEKMKLLKETVNAAKHKENQLKARMNDEPAKDSANLSVSEHETVEHEAVASQLRNEIAEAHAEMLEAQQMVHNEERSSHAAGTEPILVDTKGRRYWRLRGSSAETNVFLQDVGNWDGDRCTERWFSLDAEQAKTVEECIPTRRKRKATSQMV